MRVSTWSDLLTSLFDSDGTCGHLLPGSSVQEWLSLVQHDYDQIDRELLEYETMGG
mgnify:CR=1 FL=1